MASSGCPFCNVDFNRIRHESTHALAVPDAYPVTSGHTLVVPRRHVVSVLDLNEEERRDLWELVSRVQQGIVRDKQVHGVNVGLNDGEAAGQTVPHAHVHVIPRCRGDVPDPRGGVRWVIPERAEYWGGE